MDSPSSGERSGMSPEWKAPARAHCNLETCLVRGGWTQVCWKAASERVKIPCLVWLGTVLWGALDESRCLGMQRKVGW